MTVYEILVTRGKRKRMMASKEDPFERIERQLRAAKRFRVEEYIRSLATDSRVDEDEQRKRYAFFFGGDRSSGSSALGAALATPPAGPPAPPRTTSLTAGPSVDQDCRSGRSYGDRQHSLGLVRLARDAPGDDAPYAVIRRDRRACCGIDWAAVDFELQLRAAFALSALATQHPRHGLALARERIVIVVVVVVVVFIVVLIAGGIASGPGLTLLPGVVACGALATWPARSAIVGSLGFFSCSAAADIHELLPIGLLLLSAAGCQSCIAIGVSNNTDEADSGQQQHSSSTPRVVPQQPATGLRDVRLVQLRSRSVNNVK
ncbi:uncharacterized protein ACA1_044470 [Acanthamoeba castellanii str. Neff]|uniref:Uncharacterized protein n=1 Tax=Acanthamoeba castellanii (strain ATCC 30010 / Neff) TaxID=1257118 RepID=L8GZR4_ACACF|nr:uncharacterized protein ACA1_044470 [Acanthamoeba castellanii str. Neff]ELR18467.1 hypothetical protein ACA1_044470 [Acanthamoeba castellanii str. Neff]